MLLFFEQLVNGVALGSIYAMFGMSFGLVFSTMGIFNIAFGMIASCGALIALAAVHTWSVPFVVIAMVGFLAAGLIGLLVDQISIQPLRRRGGGFFGPIIATIGALQILTQIASTKTHGAIDRYPQQNYPSGLLTFGDFTISTMQLTDIVVALALVFGIYTFLHRSRWGLAIRAVGWHADAASLSGVAPRTVFIITAFLASAVSGLCGVLAGATTSNVSYLLGENLLFYGFAAVVVGGVGDVRGTALAGVVLGVSQVLGAQYVSGSFQDGIAFGLLLVFLMFRPKGLFGRTEVRA